MFFCFFVLLIYIRPNLRINFYTHMWGEKELNSWCQLSARTSHWLIEPSVAAVVKFRENSKPNSIKFTRQKPSFSVRCFILWLVNFKSDDWSSLKILNVLGKSINNCQKTQVKKSLQIFFPTYNSIPNSLKMLENFVWRFINPKTYKS